MQALGDNNGHNNDAGFENAYPPLHMQQTQYANNINMPMENADEGDIPDEGDALID
jgi:hypothetical protein